MNLKERQELQNQQKTSDYQRLMQLESENQHLKNQVTALTKNLKAEEDERLKIFYQREELAVQNKELRGKCNKYKAYIFALVLLFMVLMIIK